MLSFTLAFQWVGNNTNFSSKEECQESISSDQHCYRCYIRDEDFYKTFQLAVDFIVVFVSSLGLLGNFLSISILTKPEFRSRFSNLLIMLAYADISYLSMKEISAMIRIMSSFYPAQNLMNLSNLLSPYMLHPLYKVLQLVTVLITTILSIDRYIVVYYPYIVCQVDGILRTLLRGPKSKHVLPYFTALLALSTALCLPHFFEFLMDKDGDETYEDFYKGPNFWYRLIYFSIIDPFFRTILPIIILIFTYIRLLCLINKDSFQNKFPNHDSQHQKLSTLLAVVFFFVVFNLPAISLIIWELVVFYRVQACQKFDEKIGYSTWNYIGTDIASLMLVCNSAINFLLYVVFAPRFRLILKRTFRKYFSNKRHEKNLTVHSISISKVID